MDLKLDFLPNYPDIKLYQNQDMICINTDTTVLGEFLEVYRYDTILDIGTNNGSFEKYLYPNAANKAVNALPNAGANEGFSKTGVSGVKAITPKATIKVVTIVDVATLIVETTSPSGEPCFTPDNSRALTAHGTLRFTKLPVIKPKYVPLVPKSGEYVITSTTPLKKKIKIAK